MNKSLRNISRNNYNHSGDNPDREELKIGALLRIADATEVMSKNYSDLIRERDRYKKWYQNQREKNERLEKTIAGQKGWITRFRNKLNNQ